MRVRICQITEIVSVYRIRNVVDVTDEVRDTLHTNVRNI